MLDDEKKRDVLMAVKLRVLERFGERHLPADADLLPDFLRPLAWDVGFLGLTNDGSRCALYDALPDWYKRSFMNRLSTVHDELLEWLREKGHESLPNLLAQQIMVVSIAHAGELRYEGDGVRVATEPLDLDIEKLQAEMASILKR
jgi:hypothetical protein